MIKALYALGAMLIAGITSILNPATDVKPQADQSNPAPVPVATTSLSPQNPPMCLVQLIPDIRVRSEASESTSDSRTVELEKKVRLLEAEVSRLVASSKARTRNSDSARRQSLARHTKSRTKTEIPKELCDSKKVIVSSWATRGEGFEWHATICDDDLEFNIGHHEPKRAFSGLKNLDQLLLRSLE